MFSSPTGTEMFHFPALPPHRLYIHRRVTRHHSCRVSPFGHPRIHARLTAPRGISQPPTSFIGSQCQGIHHAPLNTYNDNYKPIWKNCTSCTQNPTPPQKEEPNPARSMLATTIHKSNTTPHHQRRGDNQSPEAHPGRPCHPQQRAQRHGLVVSKPNSVSGDPGAGPPGRTTDRLCTKPHATTAAGFLTAPPPPNGAALSWCSLERR